MIGAQPADLTDDIYCLPTT